MMHEHLVSLVIVVFCIPMVIRLVMLMRRSAGVARKANLLLSIILMGTTIWAAQIMYVQQMYLSSYAQFDLVDVFASLLLAVSGSGIAGWIGLVRKGREIRTVCFIVFGFTVVATLIFSLSHVSTPMNWRISWEGGVVLSLVGIFLGAIAGLLMTISRIRHGWLFAAAVLVLIILIPQHLAHFFMLPNGNTAQSVLVPLDTATLPVYVFATLSVCLLWSLAAFVAETHETSIRRAILRDAALLDPLTDLPNRLRLEQHFAAMRSIDDRRYSRPLAMIVFNIDGFKLVNKKHGVAFGDHMLKELAYRLSLQIGPKIFAARIGADEFVVLMDDVQDADQVATFVQNMHSELTIAVSKDRIRVRPEVSAGYAMLPQDGQSFDELMVKAEVALARAKVDPNVKTQRFDDEMRQQESERLSLLQDLRSAIDTDQLFLNYQMQHDIGTEELIGFEVLLRWQHPELGLVSPATFIPIAESSGLIRAIGMWVLEKTCEEAATWHRKYSVAVNVAPQQLLEVGFADMVRNVLERTGMPASRLELEITEASIIEDQENTLEVMHELRGMGIRIAMDDFGTGYSSLAMLQTFPFDKIKIDRSFVIDVHENPERAAIIQATVLIGDAMSIPILVEGVEHRDELTFLRKAKCNIIQGFIFGQPLSTEEVRELALIPERHRLVWR